jgi:ABC-type transporter Mla MlaB component
MSHDTSEKRKAAEPGFELDWRRLQGRSAMLARAQDRDDANRVATLDYSISDGTLSIRISGPLDLRCAFPLLRIGQAIDGSISTCVLDLTQVDRLLDSGIAALMLVSEQLARDGVKTIRVRSRQGDWPIASSKGHVQAEMPWLESSPVSPKAKSACAVLDANPDHGSLRIADRRLRVS